jgi:hypothetical protein
MSSAGAPPSPAQELAALEQRARLQRARILELTRKLDEGDQIEADLEARARRAAQERDELSRRAGDVATRYERFRADAEQYATGVVEEMQGHVDSARAAVTDGIRTTANAFLARLALQGPQAVCIPLDDVEVRLTAGVSRRKLRLRPYENITIEYILVIFYRYRHSRPATRERCRSGHLVHRARADERHG